MAETVALAIIAVTVLFPRITISDKNTGKTVFNIQGLLAIFLDI